MILEREEAIISSKKEWMTHYFENHHHYSYRDQDEIILSKNSVEKEIYDYICKNPGVSRKMIAQYVGKSGPAVSWHISKMESKGFIRTEPGGKSKLCFAVEFAEPEDKDVIAISDNV